MAALPTRTHARTRAGTNSQAGSPLEGFPASAMVGFAVDEKGRPVFSFSSISTHKQVGGICGMVCVCVCVEINRRTNLTSAINQPQDLMKDPRASFAVASKDFKARRRIPFDRPLSVFDLEQHIPTLHHPPTNQLTNHRTRRPPARHAGPGRRPRVLRGRDPGRAQGGGGGRQGGVPAEAPGPLLGACVRGHGMAWMEEWMGGWLARMYI